MMFSDIEHKTIEQLSTGILVNCYRDYVRIRQEGRHTNSFHLRRKSAIPRITVEIPVKTTKGLDFLKSRYPSVTIDHAKFNRNIDNMKDYFVHKFNEHGNFPEDKTFRSFRRELSNCVSFDVEMKRSNHETRKSFMDDMEWFIRHTITFLSLLRAMKEVGYVDQIKSNDDNRNNRYTIRLTKKGLYEGRRMHEILSL